MRTYQLQDFANPISVAVTNPSQSGYSRFVGLEHYDSGELVVKRYSGTELLTTTAKAFETNDILIARRNVYLKRAGIVFFDGITSGDTIVLRIKNDCESATGVPKDLAQRIIPIVLNSEHFWIYANKHADGMNSKRISKEMLLTYEFELPSLEEQRVLADKLWAAYEVKESYKNLLAQTDKLLHAQFEKMFGDPNNSYNEQELFDYDDVCFDDTKSATKIPENTFLKEGKYPIYSQGKDSEIAYTNIEDGLCNKIPVVLFGDHTREFKLIKEPFYIGADGVKLIRPKEGIQYDVEFLYYLLRYRDIPNTGYNRHYKWVKLFRLPVPPMKKQLEFVSIAEQAEQTKASLNKGIEAIEAVIRSLIAEGTTKV